MSWMVASIGIWKHSDGEFRFRVVSSRLKVQKWYLQSFPIWMNDSFYHHYFSIRNSPDIIVSVLLFFAFHYQGGKAINMSEESTPYIYFLISILKGKFWVCFFFFQQSKTVFLCYFHNKLWNFGIKMFKLLFIFNTILVTTIHGQDLVDCSYNETLNLEAGDWFRFESVSFPQSMMYGSEKCWLKTNVCWFVCFEISRS